eukprot:3744025-Rhodomonas_salina.2
MPLSPDNCRQLREGMALRRFPPHQVEICADGTLFFAGAGLVECSEQSRLDGSSESGRNSVPRWSEAREGVGTDWEHDEDGDEAELQLLPPHARQPRMEAEHCAALKQGQKKGYRCGGWYSVVTPYNLLLCGTRRELLNYGNYTGSSLYEKRYARKIVHVSGLGIKIASQYSGSGFSIKFVSSLFRILRQNISSVVVITAISVENVPRLKRLYKRVKCGNVLQSDSFDCWGKKPLKCVFGCQKYKCVLWWPIKQIVRNKCGFVLGGWWSSDQKRFILGIKPFLYYNVTI